MIAIWFFGLDRLALDVNRVPGFGQIAILGLKDMSAKKGTAASQLGEICCCRHFFI